MIKFKRYFNINEAISLKNVRKFEYKRSRGGAYRIDAINKIFGKKDRLIYDIDLDVSDLISLDNPIIYKISSFISDKYPDYEIKSVSDYINGYAFKKEDEEKKQPLRIGKMLTKFSGEKEIDDLLKSFKNDPLRSTKKHNKYKVVISRHPYDIAGMSTDRHWHSCMNLGYKGIQYSNQGPGVNKQYVQNDIFEGSIIAYLISPTDVHENGKPAIRRPLSRILMKPHINTNNRNDYAYSKGRTYGAANPKFSDFIEKWLIENINNNTKEKQYFMPSSLYPDGDISPNFKVITLISKVANRLFFNYLDSTDAKYYNKFEVISIEETDQRTLEFKIFFDIPKNIKLEKFRYVRAYPKFAQNILNQIDLEWDRSKWPTGGVSLVESFPETNTLVVEYRFTAPYDLPTDEKGNTIPESEDDVEDFWDTFMESLDVSDINYIDSYQSIINILNSVDIESDKAEELNQLKSKFREIFGNGYTSKSPRFNEQLNKHKSEYNQYLKHKEYILSLGKPTPEEMLRIAETEEYKNAIEFITLYIDNFSKILTSLRYLLSFDNYPLINAYEKWHEMLYEYFGVKRYDIPVDTLMANIRLRIDFKRDHPEEYEKLEDIYRNQKRAFLGHY
jgi:hypothetical protein